LEASSEIELHPGAEYHLILGGTGSTGYVWECGIIGPPDVILVRETLQEAPPDTGRLQNFSVNHTYIIEALGPGKAEARFVFRRPWEKDTSPLQVKSIRVNVLS